MCDRLLQLNISFHLEIYIWWALFSKKIKSGKIYRHKSMQVSRSTKPFTNHSWQVWRSIYNNHNDFKIFPTVIWAHENKQCSKMHKAINTKVQGKTSFETKLNKVNQAFWFSNFYVIFWFLTQKEKLDQKQKENQKYAQIDKQTAININNKQTIKHRHKA